jgi:hypothetical protein
MATPRSATPTTAAPAARHGNSSARQDDDVALLEAMFAHTRTRPAAPSAGAAPAALSVADELKRCGSLSGGAAATCRARICVQNPAAAACHQDP